MEKELRTLLDKTYELEGLVQLSLQRMELKSDFIRLISEKGKEINNLCARLSEATPSMDNKEVKTIIENVYSLDEEAENPTTSNEASKNIAEEKDYNPVDGGKPRGRLVFSINDKYRFRRELFNNSDVEFNNTLALVASMENYDEAEDYFINERGWRISDKSIADFLRIIKEYFAINQ